MLATQKILVKPVPLTFPLVQRRVGAVAVLAHAQHVDALALAEDQHGDLAAAGRAARPPLRAPGGAPHYAHAFRARRPPRAPGPLRGLGPLHLLPAQRNPVFFI